MGESFDVAVVGAGIVGLATARAVLARRPKVSLVVLEKEADVAAHQTGHNSGVVHSGVYYRPGSLKARLTLEGRRALLAFAREHGLRTRPIGKVIVATTSAEIPRLVEIERKAHANGVADVRQLSQQEVAARLPEITCAAGVDVPSAAIVDYGEVSRKLAALLRADGVTIRTRSRLRSAAPVDARWSLDTPGGEVRARFVINCAGLESDLVAASMGVRPPVAIVPFRGDFYHLSARLRSRVPCLVYPVPDPELPFLGVHLTPTVDGELLAGPNAALALAREGYRPGQWEIAQLARMALFPGSLGLARRYGGYAAGEWLRSWSRAEFADAVRHLWPAVEEVDFVTRSSGVRAQAVRPDGTLEDDFVFVRDAHALHVLNAPSPAATASFAIGEKVADEAGFAR